MARYHVRQCGRFGRCWHIVNADGSKVAAFKDEGTAMVECSWLNASFARMARIVKSADGR